MRYATYLLLGLFPQLLWAGSIVIGQTLPPVTLEGDAGLLSHHEREFSYSPWSTNDLIGKSHLLYVVAARMGADKINQAFLDAIESAGGPKRFPADKIKVLSLLNIDDVFPMGGGFARAAFHHARTLPENAHAIFVLDDGSRTQKAWGYSRKSNAVIITDDQGRVLRYKDGALTPEEIEDYLSLLLELAGPETSAAEVSEQ